MKKYKNVKVDDYALPYEMMNKNKK